MSRAQVKRWCFTLNNPTPEEDAALRTKFRSITYAIIGKEVGENGTPHLQMFAIFPTATRLAAIKKINPRMHAEPANGTSQQASEYCEKEGDFEKFGTLPVNTGGKSTKEDIYRTCMDLAKAGKFQDLEAAHPSLWVRHRNVFLSAPRDFGTRIPDLNHLSGIWIWGPAGTGKSRLARECFPEAYQKRINKWWDGYNNESSVLIEDVDTTHGFISHDLKLWSDRYTFPAEIKGGAITARPRHVVITSQYHIHDIWSDPPTRDALNRRMIVIYLGQQADYYRASNEIRAIIRVRDPVRECTAGESSYTINSFSD